MKKNSKSHRKFYATSMTAAVIASAVIPTAGFAEEQQAEKTFPDVPKDDHYYDAIHTLGAANIIRGFPDGTFRLGAKVERSEVAVMLAKILGLDVSDQSMTHFSDVKTDVWYTGAINALVDAGVIVGYPDGTFKPNEKVSRKELAKMIVEAYAIPAKKSNEPFVDIDGDEWFASAVETLYANKLIDGTTLTTFSPDADFKRGDFAWLLYKTDMQLGNVVHPPLTELDSAVQAAEKAITELPAVEDLTLEDAKTVTSARVLVEAVFGLDAEAEIEGLNQLEALEEQLIFLQEEEDFAKAVTAAEEAINDLPSIEDLSLEDAEALTDCRELVDAVIELGGMDGDVPNISILETLEEQLKELQEEDEAPVYKEPDIINNPVVKAPVTDLTKAVQKAEAAIGALPTAIELEDLADVQAARALVEIVWELESGTDIEGLDILKSAETAINKAAAEAIADEATELTTSSFKLDLNPGIPGLTEQDFSLGTLNFTVSSNSDGTVYTFTHSNLAGENGTVDINLWGEKVASLVFDHTEHGKINRAEKISEIDAALESLDGTASFGYGSLTDDQQQKVATFVRDQKPIEGYQSEQEVIDQAKIQIDVLTGTFVDFKDAEAAAILESDFEEVVISGNVVTLDLDNYTVKKLVVKSSNITIKNGEIDYLEITDEAQGDFTGINLDVENTTILGGDGNTATYSKSSLGTVSIEYDEHVVLEDSKANSVNLAAEGADLDLSGNETEVTAVTASAPQTTIKGTGTVNYLVEDEGNEVAVTDSVVGKKLSGAEATIQEAETAIKSLPSLEELTLEDEEKIKTARALVQAVETFGKEATDVSGIETLEALEDKLELTMAIADAETAIESLPEVTDLTLDNSRQVADARKLVDKAFALDADISIAGLATLKALENQLVVLQKEADLAAVVKTAEEAIAALPSSENVTLEDRGIVEEVRTLIQAVVEIGGNETDVDNLSVLESLEKQLEVLEEELQAETELAKAIQAAEEAIAGLPSEVTLADVENVSAARSLVDTSIKLDADAEIEGIDKLAAAEATIKQLQEDIDSAQQIATAVTKAEEVIAALPAVGDLSLENEEAVTEARALVQNVVNLGGKETDVKNLTTLEKLETQLDVLLEVIIEPDTNLAEVIEAAEAAIKSIPSEITLVNVSKLERAHRLVRQAAELDDTVQVLNVPVIEELENISTQLLSFYTKESEKIISVLPTEITPRNVHLREQARWLVDRVIDVDQEAKIADESAGIILKQIESQLLTYYIDSAEEAIAVLPVNVTIENIEELKKAYWFVNSVMMLDENSQISGEAAVVKHELLETELLAVYEKAVEAAIAALPSEVTMESEQELNEVMWLVLDMLNIDNDAQIAGESAEIKLSEIETKLLALYQDAAQNAVAVLPSEITSADAELVEEAHRYVQEVQWLDENAQVGGVDVVTKLSELEAELLVIYQEKAENAVAVLPSEITYEDVRLLEEARRYVEDVRWLDENVQVGGVNVVTKLSELEAELLAIYQEKAEEAVKALPSEITYKDAELLEEARWYVEGVRWLDETAEVGGVNVVTKLSELEAELLAIYQEKAEKAVAALPSEITNEELELWKEAHRYVQNVRWLDETAEVGGVTVVTKLSELEAELLVIYQEKAEKAIASLPSELTYEEVRLLEDARWYLQDVRGIDEDAQVGGVNVVTKLSEVEAELFAIYQEKAEEAVAALPSEITYEDAELFEEARRYVEDVRWLDENALVGGMNVVTKLSELEAELLVIYQERAEKAVAALPSEIMYEDVRLLEEAHRYVQNVRWTDENALIGGVNVVTKLSELEAELLGIYQQAAEEAVASIPSNPTMEDMETLREARWLVSDVHRFDENALIGGVDATSKLEEIESQLLAVYQQAAEEAIEGLPSEITLENIREFQEVRWLIYDVSNLNEDALIAGVAAASKLEEIEFQLLTVYQQAAEKALSVLPAELKLEDVGVLEEAIRQVRNVHSINEDALVSGLDADSKLKELETELLAFYQREAEEAIAALPSEVTLDNIQAVEEAYWRVQDVRWLDESSEIAGVNVLTKLGELESQLLAFYQQEAESAIESLPSEISYENIQALEEVLRFIHEVRNLDVNAQIQGINVETKLSEVESQIMTIYQETAEEAVTSIPTEITLENVHILEDARWFVQEVTWRGESVQIAGKDATILLEELEAQLLSFYQGAAEEAIAALPTDVTMDNISTLDSAYWLVYELHNFYEHIEITDEESLAKLKVIEDSLLNYYTDVAEKAINAIPAAPAIEDLDAIEKAHWLTSDIARMDENAQIAEENVQVQLAKLESIQLTIYKERAEEVIAALPEEITIEDAGAIEEARWLVNEVHRLNEGTQVAGIESLEALEAQLLSLHKEPKTESEEITAAEEAIAGLPSEAGLTLEDKAAVEAARSLVQAALDLDPNADIAGLLLLETLESKLESLIAEESIPTENQLLQDRIDAVNEATVLTDPIDNSGIETNVNDLEEALAALDLQNTDAKLLSEYFTAIQANPTTTVEEIQNVIGLINVTSDIIMLMDVDGKLVSTASNTQTVIDHASGDLAVYAEAGLDITEAEAVLAEVQSLVDTANEAAAIETAEKAVAALFNDDGTLAVNLLQTDIDEAGRLVAALGDSIDTTELDTNLALAQDLLTTAEINAATAEMDFDLLFAVLELAEYDNLITTQKEDIVGEFMVINEETTFANTEEIKVALKNVITDYHENLDLINNGATITEVSAALEKAAPEYYGTLDEVAQLEAAESVLALQPEEGYTSISEVLETIETTSGSVSSL